MTGVRPQAAGGTSHSVPKAPKTPVDDLDGREPEGITDNKGRVHGWRSNEGAKIGMKYLRNKGNKGTCADTEQKTYNCHDRSPQEHDLKLKTQEAGPRFQQEEQADDPLGESLAWQRAEPLEDPKKRRQRLLAQWQAKEEKETYQKHHNTRVDAGTPSSAPCKSIHTARKNEETHRQMQTNGCAHIGIHQGETSRSSVAGMQRDAHVTISLPRSNPVIVQRSSTNRIVGRSVYVNSPYI